MSAHDGTEQIADNETILRRIPVSKNWYVDNMLSPEAFDPRRDETTGISVYREKYKSISEVAGSGKSRHGYYVASILAAELKNEEIEITPRPYPDDPGHSELPGLTCHNRLEVEGEELKVRLSRLPWQIHGPYKPEEIDS